VINRAPAAMPDSPSDKLAIEWPARHHKQAIISNITPSLSDVSKTLVACRTMRDFSFRIRSSTLPSFD